MVRLFIIGQLRSISDHVKLKFLISLVECGSHGGACWLQRKWHWLLWNRLIFEGECILILGYFSFGFGLHELSMKLQNLTVLALQLVL